SLKHGDVTGPSNTETHTKPGSRTSPLPSYHSAGQATVLVLHVREESGVRPDAPQEASRYGPVARMRIKPGSEEQLAHRMREFESLNNPGDVRPDGYRMDSAPHAYERAVVFETTEHEWANAQSPAQDAR